MPLPLLSVRRFCRLAHRDGIPQRLEKTVIRQSGTFSAVRPAHKNVGIYTDMPENVQIAPK
ncbi:MAG: hypothetical protein ACI4KN_01455, partial [Gemmiger sp.]